MIHELKILPEHFYAVAAGEKNAEIRFDDRGYQVGDILVLRKWSPELGYGRPQSVKVRVTHILSDPEYLQPGYVCLSITEV